MTLFRRSRVKLLAAKRIFGGWERWLVTLEHFSVWHRVFPFQIRWSRVEIVLSSAANAVWCLLDTSREHFERLFRRLKIILVSKVCFQTTQDHLLPNAPNFKYKLAFLKVKVAGRMFIYAFCWFLKNLITESSVIGMLASWQAWDSRNCVCRLPKPSLGLPSLPDVPNFFFPCSQSLHFFSCFGFYFPASRKTFKVHTKNSLKANWKRREIGFFLFFKLSSLKFCEREKFFFSGPKWEKLRKNFFARRSADTLSDRRVTRPLIIPSSRRNF